ncbi:hypothetical protein C8R47DRAFT_1078742 [Mycena vitilis]|nr:hypothetical protein C8R47DRAFT_1078742 [Mycena vitilis]
MSVEQALQLVAQETVREDNFLFRRLEVAGNLAITGSGNRRTLLTPYHHHVGDVAGAPVAGAPFVLPQHWEGASPDTELEFTCLLITGILTAKSDRPSTMLSSCIMTRWPLLRIPPPTPTMSNVPRSDLSGPFADDCSENWWLLNMLDWVRALAITLHFEINKRFNVLRCTSYADQLQNQINVALSEVSGKLGNPRCGSWPWRKNLEAARLSNHIHATTARKKIESFEFEFEVFLGSSRQAICYGILSHKVRALAITLRCEINETRVRPRWNNTGGGFGRERVTQEITIFDSHWSHHDDTAP